MIIEIPDEILNKNNISKERIRLEVALLLYEKNLMTIEQASRFAHIDSYEFQKILGTNKIRLHYYKDDFKDDLNTIKGLF